MSQGRHAPILTRTPRVDGGHELRPAIVLTLKGGRPTLPGHDPHPFRSRERVRTTAGAKSRNGERARVGAHRGRTKTRSTVAHVQKRWLRNIDTAEEVKRNEEETVRARVTKEVEQDYDEEMPSQLPRSETQLARDIVSVAEKFSRERSVLVKSTSGAMHAAGDDAAKRLGEKQAVLIKQFVSTMKTKRKMVRSFSSLGVRSSTENFFPASFRTQVYLHLSSLACRARFPRRHSRESTSQLSLAKSVAAKASGGTKTIRLMFSTRWTHQVTIS